LLLGRFGDLFHPAGCIQRGGKNGGQGLLGLGSDPGGGGDLLFSLVHGLEGPFDGLLDLGQDADDFPGGFSGLIRQLTNFLGDHRKTPPVFTGPGGFDGGVQGEEVGLTGDVGDDPHHLFDTAGALTQSLHSGGDILDGSFDPLNLADGVLDGTGSGLSGTPGLLGELR
jgi:hypothetical protein